MLHLIPNLGLEDTIRFEGEAYGAGVSFFAVDAEPGDTVALHRHPYPETWVVRSGRVHLDANGQQAELGPGDIVVVTTGTPHRYTAIGPDRLDMVCIHDAGRVSTTWLEPSERDG
ncbi:Cupin domain-containing protein [Amycolatopsis arida]|uniref:Cupin domain-containing protein n=1 Tax=Amycolatopsis arida TaxID=587909 RepID=A0A1I5PA95_9PSEU|nr:cupin domain-containing protein [Amycolatopsis arida]TDX98417.1 Cupin domain-containing protein [Amycolatopsis arida]SFP30847.1 Cupin domain-containing protein [Amycolatopsis arida]